jgi:adenylosuccinate lyase
LSKLLSISPIDGRYANKVTELTSYFSEYALIKYRVMVEIEYFIALCDAIPQLSDFPKSTIEDLRKSYLDFQEKDAERIKEIESVTNHDVKAVEYFLKEKFDALNLSQYKEFIHFGLTSQDINNTAVPYSIARAVEDYVKPLLKKLISQVEGIAIQWKDIPMLAHTHGQPASPTALGKEMRVFSERLHVQLEWLNAFKMGAKFGGATGNFNAHKVAYPDVDWTSFANSFLQNSLQLERQQTTTQIEHYDNMAALFDVFARINNILLDFSRDIWTYISMGYFGQKIKAGEVGSSAMPHKVNPIDFENAEGNLGMANAVFRHLSSKLPVSRLQRDLTDSTVLRNVGVPYAHSCIAYHSLSKGIDKLLVNEEAIRGDLENNWAVVAEAIQTILRREGYPEPYEALKGLTRTGEHIGQTEIHNFINGLSISDEVKSELLAITPYNYLGYSK